MLWAADGIASYGAVLLLCETPGDYSPSIDSPIDNRQQTTLELFFPVLAVNID